MNAESDRGQVGAAVQDAGAVRDVKSVALRAEQGGGRDAAVVEDQFPEAEAVQAHGRLVGGEGHPRSARLHQEGR